MDHSHTWAVVLAGGEGTRVRSFLQQFCGGSGLKQFSTIIGQRSMLHCTLDRVVQLIPPERVLIVVSAQHREDVEDQLAHWPRENIIYQPANRDTAPGILLPLAHITNRDPAATVVVFPSDHFILDEDRFMDAVQKALLELQSNPSRMILLGMPPQRGEETEYGYIVGTGKSAHAGAIPVAGFVEKPPLTQAKELIQRGALWNTMVFAVENGTLWDMVQRTAPILYHAFRLIQMNLHAGSPPQAVEHIYQAIPAVNFSSSICEPLAARLCVLPVPDVGWSDWGTVGSILRTLKKLGEFDAFCARAGKPQVQPAWQSSKRSTARAAASRTALSAPASSMPDLFIEHSAGRGH
jgi:mannose-1-phosphate guanylyltransferase